MDDRGHERGPDREHDQVLGACADTEIVKAAAKVIRQGSLSFALAASLLGRKQRAAIHLLYAWLRHCDDVIDAQSLGRERAANARSDSPLGRATRLNRLKAATHAALEGELLQEYPFRGLSQLASTYQMPKHCFDDFLSGMQFDVDGQQPESFSDLRLYCYRVAGTVGQLFAYIVGVSDPAALRNAVHLGIAMQLTNIARDIAEDDHAGRCYLPKRWAEQAGITRGSVMALQNRAAVVGIAARIVRTADHYYRSGDAGIERLPFRAALAVAAARRIYAEIGRQVVARGANAWTSRTVVSSPRKLWLLVQAVSGVLIATPKRLLKPWKAAALPQAWRFT